MIAIRYTIMRLMIFTGFFAILMLLDVDLVWSAVGAALLSMVASYFLLARDRERMAAGIERRVEDRMERRAAKVEAERSLEDEEDAEVEGAEIDGDGLGRR